MRAGFVVAVFVVSVVQFHAADADQEASMEKAESRSPPARFRRMWCGCDKSGSMWRRSTRTRLHSDVWAWNRVQLAVRRIDLLNPRSASTELDAGRTRSCFFPQRQRLLARASVNRNGRATLNVFDRVGGHRLRRSVPAAARRQRRRSSFVRTDVPIEPPTRGAGSLVLLLTDGVPNCNPNNVNTCQGRRSHVHYFQLQGSFASGFASMRPDGRGRE